MRDIVLKKLKIPAIGLITSGFLNGTLGIIMLVSGLVRFSGLQEKEQFPTEQAELIGYLISTFGIYGMALLSVIVAPIIVFGGIRMLNGQSRGLIIASSILSILPFTSCCFLLSAIFGIWALVVLQNSDVKTFFKNAGQQS